MIKTLLTTKKMQEFSKNTTIQQNILKAFTKLKTFSRMEQQTLDTNAGKQQS